MNKTVGINVGHDAGISVLDFDNNPAGELTIYEAERFSKHKHHAFFPLVALKRLFLENKDLFQLPNDHVATCCYSVGAKDRELTYSKKGDYTLYLKKFGAQQLSILTNDKMTELSHHLCHAYSALYFSPFQKSIIIIADGIGSHGDAYLNSLNDQTEPISQELTKKDFESISVYLQDGKELKLVEKFWGHYQPFIRDGIFLNDGLGSYFAAVSNYLFGTWAEAGKVMGLSAYGEDIEQPESILEYLRDEFQKERKLFKGKEVFDQQPEENFKRSATISKVLQKYFEEHLLSLVRKLKKKYPEFENLTMAGGCALNCLTISKIVDTEIFNQVFIPPCPNDEGISIGAAYYKALDLGLTKFEPRNINSPAAYLGSRSILKSLSNEEEIKKHFTNYTVEKLSHPSQRAAEVICEGEVIAWFQGRSECGPRALGNRSILSLPSIQGRKKYLNDHIKFREEFRPYGCSVTLESAHLYFNCPKNYQMPYMSFAPTVKDQAKIHLTEVTHIDDTCRIQTVTSEQNPRYYELLKSVEEIQGHPLLLNTSLNIMGQPILETLTDAATFFKASKINFLFIGDYLITK